MTKDFNFTKALARLEEIVAKLENQDLELEEAIKLLTEGVSLHKMCQEKLTGAKNKIDKLFIAKKEVKL